MAEEPSVFPDFRQRLSNLEQHVEDHDVANADLKDLAEFEAAFFSLARDLLEATFELPKGFTYEEAGGLIEKSERTAPLRAKGVKVAQLLNSLEYAPDRSYHAIDEHLILLGELIDLAEREPRAKALEEHGPTLLSKIGSAIAKATSLLWFPFKWAYLSMRRKGHERKVEQNATYRVDNLIDKAEKQLEKERIEDAIKTYRTLATEYAKLPDPLKARTRERVLAIHERIMKHYESLKN